MPSAYLKPAYILLSVSLVACAIGVSTIVQIVSCRACCQCIQLESSSLSLFFMPTLQSGSSPPLLLTAEVHIDIDMWTFNHCEIFESAYFKFTVSGLSKHTHVCAMHVMLVWGSLRFAPTNMKLHNQLHSVHLDVLTHLH